MRLVFEPFRTVPLGDLMRRALAGEVFDSETAHGSTAAQLREEAKRRGLDLVQVDSSECIEIDAGTWIPDGAADTPFASGPGVFAVGWLSAFHPFRAGRSDARVADILDRMVANRRWLPVAAGGCQTCEFCAEARGAQALLIPAGEVLFVAPDLVGHYMRCHHYNPPESFSEAVRQCPEPGSRPYYDGLRRFQSLWPVCPIPADSELGG